MFCSNCGLPVPAESKFCPNCGTQVFDDPNAPIPSTLDPIPAPVEETPVVETPVTEAPIVEAPPVMEEPPVVDAPPVEPPFDPKPEQGVQTFASFAQADFTPPSKKKAKKPVNKKKLGITLGITGVLVAIATTLCILFWPQISGFFLRIFGTPEAYFQHVEEQSAKSTAQTVSKFYGNYIDALSGDQAAKGTMKLKVSDRLVQLLQSTGAMNALGSVDMMWLNDVSIDYTANTQDGKTRMDMALKVQGKTIADLVMLTDLSTGKIYIALPSLGSDYLELSSTDAFTPSMGMNSAMSGLGNILTDKEFINALPSESDIATLLERYLKIVIENTGEVEKSTEKMSVGDLEQNITVLEYDISQEDLLDILKAVLKEVKNDKDIKRCLTNLVEYLGSKGMPDADSDQVYDAFRNAISALINNLDEADASSKTMFTLTDYVDAASKIVGRRVDAEGQLIFEYITLTKGKEFATEVNIADGQVKLEGDGTISGDTQEGSYTLMVENQDMLTIDARYDTKRLSEGYLNGRFCLRPTSNFLLKGFGLNSQVASLISGMSLGLELDISGGASNGSVAINLVSGSDVLLGLETTSSATASQPVQMPGSSQIVRYNNADSWASSLDLNKIVNALQGTSVPQELISALQLALYSVSSPSYGSSDNNDYDFNFGYEQITPSTDSKVEFGYSDVLPSFSTIDGGNVSVTLNPDGSYSFNFDTDDESYYQINPDVQFNIDPDTIYSSVFEGENTPIMISPSYSVEGTQPLISDHGYGSAYTFQYGTGN